MRVSIVTNAYNQAQFLRQALDSVLDQGWDDLQFIVNDPGSTDGTRAILEEYDARHPGKLTLVFEKDAGPADGLNNGFARADGELFMYLNADDFLLPGAIATAVKAAQRFPKAGAIYSDGYIVDIDGKPVRRAISTPFTPKGFVYGSAFVLQQSTYYRASAFRAVGGFNTANKTSWDAEILLDMALKGIELRHVPGFWSAFRIHGDSITGSQRLAEESARNHRRFFQTVMGRERTRRDDRLRKLNQLAMRITSPRATVMRIADQIRPPAALKP